MLTVHIYLRSRLSHDVTGWSCRDKADHNYKPWLIWISKYISMHRVEKFLPFSIFWIHSVMLWRIRRNAEIAFEKIRAKFDLSSKLRLLNFCICHVCVDSKSGTILQIEVNLYACLQRASKPWYEIISRNRTSPCHLCVPFIIRMVISWDIIKIWT